MISSKNAYWNDRSDVYQYSQSTVLKNIPGIENGAELEAFELNVTTARMPEALAYIRNQPVGLKLWQDIHRILFQDIFEWAGRFRTVQMSKGDTLFAHPENIQSEGGRIFLQLNGENNLEGLQKPKLCQRLAYYFSECNALHPFREGNGRTQKFLFGEIVKRLNHHIDWKRLSSEEHLQAVIAGYQHRFEQLTAVFEKIIIP